MKRAALVALAMAGLIAVYYYHTSQKDVAVIDVMEYPRDQGQPSHVVLHTSSMIISADCHDAGGHEACRVFNAGERVKISTMGNTLIFTDRGMGNVHSWEIESERLR